MTLPRNEYTRACARMAGKLRFKASKCGGVRMGDGDGKRGPWIIDDPAGYYDRIDHLQDEAYRWRNAWWCSENAGVQIDAGKLTVKALSIHIVYLSFMAALPLAVVSSVAAVMYFGAMVLP